MEGFYFLVAAAWIVGALYTFGLRWMIRKYEHWEPERNLEHVLNNSLFTILIWPFVLGVLHAPAFVDRKHAERNKKHGDRLQSG